LKDGEVVGRRRTLKASAAIAAIGLAGTLAACSSSSSSGAAAGGSSASGKTITNVVFGYSNANLNNWASTRMDEDPSYCAPYGVRVTSEILNTTAYTPAIDTDQVNFVFASGNVMDAMAKGTVHNEKVIAYLGLNAPAEVYGMWAGPQITSASQLNGKTIGASSVTSPGHIGGVALLQSAGLSPSQYNYTYLGTNGALLAALAHGTIAAAWNNGPLPAANTAAGDHIVIPLSSDPSVQPINGFYMVGNTAWMAAHPAATKGVMQCLAAATKGGRSDDPAVLSTYQSMLAKQVGTVALAAKAWPEYPISAGLLPMTGSAVTNLQQSMTLQLGKSVPLSTITGMISTTAMQGVTPVPVVNETGASKYPVYSGK
jgi:ABC-type nitrate/sulfonate/bicarbonate transport system substrate-binding protein